MKVRAAEDLSTALYCRLSVDDGVSVHLPQNYR